MKVSVDISIISKSAGAFGVASGTLEFEIVPQIGDTISFATPRVAGLPRVVGFSGMLRVVDRMLNAGGGSSAGVSLEDIVVPSVEEARAVATYLEKGFGLGVDIH